MAFPYRSALAFAVLLALAPPDAVGAEKREGIGSEIDDTIKRLTGESDVERMDRFVIFNEKLKSAVCDENFVTKAPTLEPITAEDARGVPGFRVTLDKGVPEHELISFMLGDSIAGLYSDFVRSEVKTSLKSRGLEAAARSRSLSGDRFIEAQNAVIGVKRRVALDVCEALVDLHRLRKLLHARPSRFIEATPVAAPTPVGKGVPGTTLVEVTDSEGRFGQVGDRVSTRKKYLVPGWLEAFEIDRITVFGPRGAPVRIYRRISNPVTNNTQGIEIMNAQGMPLGVLYLSREATATSWATYRSWSEQPEARTKQIETYRSRIESEAVRVLAAAKQATRDQVRNLQEFYKNLLQAYQLFPNEKQFETYAKSSGRKPSLDDVLRGPLGSDFLSSLGQARVNGSHVHVGLFKPDAKLHAIYSEYAERLAKLK